MNDLFEISSKKLKDDHEKYCKTKKTMTFESIQSLLFQLLNFRLIFQHHQF